MSASCHINPRNLIKNERFNLLSSIFDIGAIYLYRRISRGIYIPDDVLYYLAVWLNITALSLVLEKRKSTQQKKIITIIRSWMFLDKSMIDINQIKSDQTSGNSHRICWYWNAKKRYEEASLQYLEQSVREFCLYCSLWQDVEVRRVLIMIVTCLEVTLTKKSSKCRYDQEWPRSHIV